MQFEAYVHCPMCGDAIGEIWRKQVSPDVWKNVTKPATMPKRCSRCDVIVERKLDAAHA